MASITDAIDFANFDEQNDTNGSGVDTSDTFNNWRRKTNGIINELGKITPFAKTKISWASGPVFSQYADSYNIDSVTYVTQADDENETPITGTNSDGGLRLRFTTAHPTGDYLVFAQMNRAGGAQATGISSRNYATRSQDVATFNQTTLGLTISMMGQYTQTRNDGTTYPSQPPPGSSYFGHAADAAHFDSVSILVFS